MRYRIGIAATIVAAIVVPASAEAAVVNPASDRTCDGMKADHHEHRARVIIREGHDESRYPDPSPMKRSEKADLRRHKFCLLVPALREQVVEYRAKVAAEYRHGLDAYLGDVAPWLTPEGKALVASVSGWLANTRECESGGDYQAVDASGTYYGAYQFDFSTWASVGGSGSPADASPAEQDYRAALLYSRAGSSPWPVCG